MGIFAGGARAIPTRVAAGARNPQALYDDLVVADLPTGFWLLDDYSYNTDAVVPDGSVYAAKVGTPLIAYTNGTIGPKASDDAPFYPGFIKHVARNAGVSFQRVGLNSIPNIDAIVDNITVEGWFYVNAWTDAAGMASSDNGLGNGLWNLTFVHVGARYQWSTNHDTEIVNGVVEPGLGEWHHYVGTRKRNDFTRLYFDGAEVANAAVANVAMTRTDPTYKGLAIMHNMAAVRSGTEYPLNGRASRVAIYNYALTAAQVLAHYNARTTV